MCILITKFLPACIIFALLAGCGTKESKKEITFKSISFNKPGAKKIIENICSDEYKIPTCGNWPNPNKLATLVTYGNIRAVGTFILTDNDSLASVELWDKEHDVLALAEILKEEFGKPVEATGGVQNERGSPVAQRTFVWNDSYGSRITIESLVDGTNLGRVSFLSGKLAAERDDLVKSKKQSIKNSL